jgi:CRISPR-associated endoribonuclease Cas6
MLIASTWTLTPQKNALLPRSYCLELSKQLHQQIGLDIGNETIPSTTFYGLIGYYTRSDDFYNFFRDQVYHLYLTGLTNHSSQAIANLDLSDSLEFLGTQFQVINREHNITSYEQLYTNLVAEEPSPIRQFTFDFLTPTTFATQGTHLPFPIPALMFRSWLQRWNHFAPIYLGGDELISYLTQAIRVKRHRLQTRNFQLHRGFMTGFTGEVTLQLPFRTDPLLAHVSNLLANYAIFCGTGVKTRLGMGQSFLAISEK